MALAAQQNQIPEEQMAIPSNEIGMRGQMSQMGTPESPAPLQPPPEQMEMEGLLAQMGADQGMADNATPLPIPEENPLNNIQPPMGV